MFKGFNVLGVVCALFLGLFAAESQAGFFGRRLSCVCARVYYCPCAQVPVAEPKPEDTIRQVLDDWYDAAAKADTERYLDHLANDSVFLGTDATERWDKKAFRAYVEPRFSQGKGWTYSAKERVIVLAKDGGSAWFDETLDSKHVPMRASGVLVKQADGWRIAQYNLSFLVPNNVAPAVEKIIAAEVSLQKSHPPQQ